MRVFFNEITSPSWLWIWDLLEFFSIIVVIVGCWGEGWAEHHNFSDVFASPRPMMSSKEKWMRRFWAMVVVGLGIEMFGFGLSFIASNREIEGLRSDNA